MELFRLAVESAPAAMILVDARGHIALANRQAERLSGYDRAELIGAPLARLGAGTLALAGGAAGEPIPGRRLAFTRKDGAEVPVDVEVRPVAGGHVLLTMLDATERRRAEDERAALLAREQAARAQAEALAAVGQAMSGSLDLPAVLQRITDSACDLLRADVAAVYRVDGAGRTMRLAAAAGPLAPSLDPDLGMPRGTGMVWLAAERREVVVTDDLLADPRFGFTPAMRQRIEAARHRPSLAVPLVVHGRLIGGLFVGALPGRTFAEDELRLATAFADHAALAIANAELYREVQDASRSKDEFLAMLAHELRNPLAAIASAAGVLEAAGDDAAVAARSRQVIQRQTGHLNRLMDDLLDVARLTADKLVLAPAAVDLAEVAAHCVADLAQAGELGAHGVEVAAREAWVRGDAARLQQVIANLLTNAVKHTPPGGRIALEVGREAGDAVLAVTDTGAGIASELLPRIFDLFAQGEQGLDPARAGLGLGLALVRRLVEQHGGRVEAHSAGPGRGSRFVVSLPAIEAPEPSAAHPRAEAAARARVLVVDDNADVRDMLELLLEVHGHEVHATGDAESALAEARARPPDIALVDLGLPGIDGHELARRLRAAMPGVRLVAVTGYGQPEDRRRSAEAGFDEHLVKPVDPDRLLRIVERR
jgi:PAS domain S-box-containing protein